MTKTKKRLQNIFQNSTGSGYMDTVVLVIISIMTLAFGMQLFEVYMTKQKVDTFATELMGAAKFSNLLGNKAVKLQQKQRLRRGIWALTLPFHGAEQGDFN